MSATVQAAANTVKSAVSATGDTVSNTASAAANAVASNPTARHADGAQPAAETNSMSPRDDAAKEKLDKLFASRPDRKELVDKNILKNSNVAPSLQAKQAELERSQLEDMLQNKLQARPSPEELVKEGILLKDEAPGV